MTDMHDPIRRLASHVKSAADRAVAAGTAVAAGEAGNTTTAALAAHVADVDPHTQYLTEAEGDVRYALAPALSDPTTTEGDLIYRGPVSLTRLGVGSVGQFLGVAAGVPAWGAVAASVVSGLQEAVEDIIGAAVKAGGSNVTVTYNDTTGETTVSVTLQAHASSHATIGSDPIAPADIGAYPASGGVISGASGTDGSLLVDVRAGSTVRHTISNRGVGRWDIHDGTSEAGRIIYAALSSVPIIGFFDASLASRSDMRLVAGGGFAFAVTSGSGVPPVIVEVEAAGLNLSSGKVLKVNGTQVLGARRTGWTAATGTASRATYATTTVTTEQLAQRVKALLDDLIAHGVIGA
jgi:hypothetical protein